MSWAETKKINSNLDIPLNQLIGNHYQSYDTREYVDSFSVNGFDDSATLNTLQNDLLFDKTLFDGSVIPTFSDSFSNSTSYSKRYIPFVISGNVYVAIASCGGLYIYDAKNKKTTRLKSAPVTSNSTTGFFIDTIYNYDSSKIYINYTAYSYTKSSSTYSNVYAYNGIYSVYLNDNDNIAYTMILDNTLANGSGSGSTYQYYYNSSVLVCGKYLEIKNGIRNSDSTINYDIYTYLVDTSQDTILDSTVEDSNNNSSTMYYKLGISYYFNEGIYDRINTITVGSDSYVNNTFVGASYYRSYNSISSSTYINCVYKPCISYRVLDDTTMFKLRSTLDNASSYISSLYIDVITNISYNENTKKVSGTRTVKKIDGANYYTYYYNDASSYYNHVANDFTFARIIGDDMILVNPYKRYASSSSNGYRVSKDRPYVISNIMSEHPTITYLLDYVSNTDKTYLETSAINLVTKLCNGNSGSNNTYTISNEPTLRATSINNSDWYSYNRYLDSQSTSINLSIKESVEFTNVEQLKNYYRSIVLGLYRTDIAVPKGAKIIYNKKMVTSITGNCEETSYGCVATADGVITLSRQNATPLAYSISY